MFQVLCCIFILINNEEGPQNNQEAKSFWIFFVDCSIIDAKLIFVTPTYGTWCIQKGVQLKLGIVFLDFTGFLFWSTKWRDPPEY